MKIKWYAILKANKIIFIKLNQSSDNWKKENKLLEFMETFRMVDIFQALVS